MIAEGLAIFFFSNQTAQRTFYIFDFESQQLGAIFVAVKLRLKISTAISLRDIASVLTYFTTARITSTCCDKKRK